MVSEKISDVINGNTTILGILGNPISHSLSPVMHNAVFRSLGWNCWYIPCRVRSEDLAAAVRGLRALNFKGVNVTIPHKQAISAELDELFGDSTRSGSINTVIHRNGRLYGTSTDGIGLVNSLKVDGGFELYHKKVLLLGAGGSATAIVYRLIDAGIDQLWIMNRSQSNASDLQQRLFLTTGFAAEIVRNQQLAELEWDAIDLIINTTSVGLSDHESLIPKEYLKKRHFVYDIVYKKGETRLIQEAASAGCKVLSGLSMLLFQGLESFKIWFEVEPPLEVMRQALLEQ